LQLPEVDEGSSDLDYVDVLDFNSSSPELQLEPEIKEEERQAGCRVSFNNFVC
jgi:hypothetical protein